MTLQAGARSLEGPRVAEATETLEIRNTRTLPGADCVRLGSPGDHPPGATWRIELNNEIEAESFDEAMIGVEPPVERLTASVSGSYVNVTAASVANETYQVTLDPALRDVFGQILGSSEPVRVEVGPPEPRLAIPGQSCDSRPEGRPMFAVRLIGIKQVRVQVHTVRPADWTEWQEAQGAAGQTTPSSLQASGSRRCCSRFPAPG